MIDEKRTYETRKMRQGEKRKGQDETRRAETCIRDKMRREEKARQDEKKRDKTARIEGEDMRQGRQTR